VIFLIENTNCADKENTEDDENNGSPMVTILLFTQEANREESANRHDKAAHHLPNTDWHHSQGNIHDCSADNIAAGWDGNPRRIDIGELLDLLSLLSTGTHWHSNS